MSDLPQPVSLSNYSAHESIIAMFYGPAGSGKSELAATAGSRTLIINTGKGMATLKSPGFKARHPNIDPLIVDISENVSNHGYVKTSKMYDLVCDVIDEQLTNNPDAFDTIVIDDLTSLRRSALIKGMEINQSTGRSASHGLSNKMMIPVKGVQDYGIEMDLISQFISGYAEICQRLKKNLIILAHERLTLKKGDKLGDIAQIQRIRPAVTGEKFPDDLPQYFDVIGYCNVLHAGNERKYRVKFSLDNIILAKNRWSGVKVNDNSKETYDEQVTNFDFQHFVERVRLSQSKLDANHPIDFNRVASEPLALT